ncbi:hypothetical protein [Spelaeicoccus albus]|uniref:ATP/GTP-binding protein n=1 Tax=Spelaeicoccus albus TaxID=1280376 RepID=A0A7Z0IJ16_9MICO|nr:hypothetical protein [Spelaeicoccus albus]NYI68961.1 hypothetical protein [Spelaeicoccus albus]
MPRSNRPRRRGKKQSAGPEEGRDLESALTGMPRHVSGADGDWTMRRVRGGDKAYRCPGCDQLIAPGTAHTVAWRADDVLGSDHALTSRRHWHDACWAARGRRGPTRR